MTPGCEDRPESGALPLPQELSTQSDRLCTEQMLPASEGPKLTSDRHKASKHVSECQPHPSPEKLQLKATLGTHISTERKQKSQKISAVEDMEKLEP